MDRPVRKGDRMILYVYKVIREDMNGNRGKRAKRLVRYESELPLRKEKSGMKTKVKLTAVLMAALMVFDACLLPSVAAAGEEEAVEVPEDVAGISEELGRQYSICPETIQAVCWVESRFDPEAENDGCTGIMQVSGKWHKDRMERLGVEDLKDTEGCMRVAVDYLAELVEDGEDMEAALMRYHGESRIRERLSEGELSEYVDKVLAVSAMLEQRNGK